jgi:hypothetical protein
LEKPSPISANLKVYYADANLLAEPFRQIVAGKIQSEKTPELAAHIRQQLIHHFNSSLTVVTSSLYLVYKLNQPKTKSIENLRHIHNRVVSFEQIIQNISKNSNLMDYILAQQLPNSIPESELKPSS